MIWMKHSFAYKTLVPFFCIHVGLIFEPIQIVFQEIYDAHEVANHDFTIRNYVLYLGAGYYPIILNLSI